MAISSSFEGLGPLQNQNFKPPSATLTGYYKSTFYFIFLNLVPGHKYGGGYSGISKSLNKIFLDNYDIPNRTEQLNECIAFYSFIII